MVLIAKDSHRKFANKQDYQFFKNGKSVGHIIINFKLTEKQLKKELLEFANMCKADRIVLYWSAVEGFVNREVHL